MNSIEVYATWLGIPVLEGNETLEQQYSDEYKSVIKDIRVEVSAASLYYKTADRLEVARKHLEGKARRYLRDNKDRIAFMWKIKDARVLPPANPFLLAFQINLPLHIRNRT